MIKADLTAPGEVDERSIEEVKPDDLRGFTQCHFFAGIGVWSYALRAAGWADDLAVWTGSCPCQGFSASGQRGGFSDKRHLWPAWFRLISECRPVTVFGEQVASKDGLAWLDVVSADLEGAGYAIGTADTCAAGFGAPHIRQRLYFVAEPNRPKREARFIKRVRENARSECAAQPGSPSELVNTTKPRREGDMAGAVFRGRDTAGEDERATGPSAASDMVDAERAGSQRRLRSEYLELQARTESLRSATASSGVVELAHANSIESSNGELQRGGRLLQPSENPLTGFWRDAEWIYCRDEKWRPVEPGTFPLVTGTPNRVGRLRGYGNAINAEVAKAFIEAYMSIEGLKI